MSNKIEVNMKSLGYVVAVLGGALTGAVVALALAPSSGKDTRNKVKGAVEDLMKKYNIKPCHKDVEECVDKVEEAVAE